MVAEAPPQPGLARSIGLGRVLFHTIANMGPGGVVALGLGQVVLYAGPAAPASMLIGAVAAVAVAFAIGQLAVRIPSSGGLYAYAVAAFGDRAGSLVGWLYGIYALGLVCISSLAFSIVLSGALQAYFNFTPSPYLIAPSLILVFAALTYLGIRPSTSVTLVLGIAEVTLLTVIAIVLIMHAGGANTLAVFNPANATSSGHPAIIGLLLGTAIAFAALSGFESAAPLAEESTHPRRTVPRAVILSAIGIGSFFVLCMYAAVVAWGPSRLASYPTAVNPWRQMAAGVSSVLGVLVVVTILDSILGGLQGHFNSTSRLTYALGRARLFPALFMRVHPRHRTPEGAILAIAVVALSGVLVAMTVFNGAYPALVFFIVIIGVPPMVLYACTCVALPVYYWRQERGEFSWVRHVLPAAIGLAVLLPAIYAAFQGLQYPANIALLVLLTWMLAGIVVQSGLLRRRPIGAGTLTPAVLPAPVSQAQPNGEAGEQGE